MIVSVWSLCGISLFFSQRGGAISTSYATLTFEGSATFTSCSVEAEASSSFSPSYSYSDSYSYSYGSYSDAYAVSGGEWLSIEEVRSSVSLKSSDVGEAVW